MSQQTSAPTPEQEQKNQALIKLFSAGDLAGLIKMAEQFIQQDASHAFAWKALGLGRHSQGQTEAALIALKTALDLQADDIEGHCNFGVILQAHGRLEEANAAFERALELDPDYPEARRNLGLLQFRQNRMHEAEGNLRHALSVQPVMPEARMCLVTMLERQGRFAEALALLGEAHQSAPADMTILNQIGRTLQTLGRLNEAEEILHHVTAQAPTFVEAHNNLGVVFQAGGRLADAEAAFRRALNLRPQSAEILSNLGNVLQNMGRFIESQTCYRRALAIKPSFFEAHSNLIGALNEYENVAPETRLTEALRYGENVEKHVTTKYSEWPRPANGKLRIGFVSADLRQHPVGYFLSGVLPFIDRDRFELHAYVSGHAQDNLSTTLMQSFSSWTPIAHLDDEVAATRIHADNIDLLIDLSGHTADNRLPLFARKPAPVQLSWLGYFSTTGVKEIDWLIADTFSITEENRRYFTERLWLLPETRLCFSPPVEAPATSPLPMLKKGYPTFGCFQNLAKLSDRTLTLWARVLESVPESRLRIQSKRLDQPDSIERTYTQLQQFGIPRERIDLFGAQPRAEYLASHSEVDLILDTLPYNGGTTTCEALWMGVPTITLIGDSLIGRQGASILKAANLSDWITNSEEEFITQAVSRIGKPDQLETLRQTMRDRLAHSALFDGAAFAKQLETAWSAMWEGYTQG